MNLNISEAFARYGAKRKNVRYSVSAWASNGALVVSMWDHNRRPGTLVYEGSTSRWQGAGRSEFRRNMTQAHHNGSPVRLVIVRVLNAEDVARVEACADVPKIKKEFFCKEEVIGKVTEWDGDHYVITFEKMNTDEREVLAELIRAV